MPQGDSTRTCHKGLPRTVIYAYIFNGCSLPRGAQVGRNFRGRTPNFIPHAPVRAAPLTHTEGVRIYTDHLY